VILIIHNNKKSKDLICNNTLNYNGRNKQLKITRQAELSKRLHKSYIGYVSLYI